MNPPVLMACHLLRLIAAYVGDTLHAFTTAGQEMRRDHIPPMHEYKSFNLLIFTVFMSLNSSAQKPPGPARYINPMDIPLNLSGNFMEPRNDHFHAGLDMRTGGREGIPVMAVADGFVSRIKISPYGYGKAVYIQHPDGYTSVYGHLQRLEGKLGEHCLAAQYARKDLSIDIFPERNELPVAQGDIIGLSGNTGGSAGPHLHFELRRTGDQHAVDPEALGFDIPDRSKPVILGLRIHPLTDNSRVQQVAGDAGMPVHGSDGNFSLKGSIPAAFGTVGLAVHVIDRYDDNSGKFGVRSIDLQVDSVNAFSTVFDHVDFDQARYCNAHMDYELFKGRKLDYHRLYRQPNNKLRIYGTEPMQGRITLQPGRTHRVRVVATDAHGNRSELRFELRGATLEEVRSWPSPELQGSLFRYDTENILAEDGVSLTLPPLALYDDTYVRYSRSPAPKGAITPLHRLHHPLTPIQLKCMLRMDLPALSEGELNKALIVRVGDNGKVDAVGGQRNGRSISASVRSFGNYTVMLDSTPPTITPMDLRPDMKGRGSFNLKIGDDLSGIATYTGSLDGNWVLMEYEPKTRTLTHTFDRYSKAIGKRNFVLQVVDDRGNSSTYTYSFQQ